MTNTNGISTATKMMPVFDEIEAAVHGHEKGLWHKFRDRAC
jgi:hypothetical protein